ncbi:MAG: hypothetical protein WB783_01725 [Arenicellales bacterium]
MCTVDGHGWPNWDVSDFDWEKHTQYQYGPGFVNGSVSVLVNLDKWRGFGVDHG